MKIKASGGIRTLEDARAMIEAGADRLGCSASVAIMEEYCSRNHLYHKKIPHRLLKKAASMRNFLLIYTAEFLSYRSVATYPSVLTIWET